MDYGKISTWMKTKNSNRNGSNKGNFRENQTFAMRSTCNAKKKEYNIDGRKTERSEINDQSECDLADGA